MKDSIPMELLYQTQRWRAAKLKSLVKKTQVSQQYASQIISIIGQMLFLNKDDIIPQAGKTHSTMH